MDNYPYGSYTAVPAQSPCQGHTAAGGCAESRKVALGCGSGSAGPLPVLDLAGASIVNPYAVASASLNLEGMKNPKVLLTFTGLINVPLGALPNISFRLVRACNGASQAVGGSFNYSSAIDVLHSDTFAFQVCDCGECCDCVTYTVEVSNATLAAAGTTISGTISILAVDGGGCGCG